MPAQATPKQIRDFLGHGQGNRKVRITRDGRVEFHGSTDAANRSCDFRQDGRWIDGYRVASDGTVYAA